ncbi:unnamed protein product [Ostreobium quekettii]|uniref:Uncharacterized protein n=1 Tax=Ostreobium quekettii TaxID=121088 RepID=A0A8S1JB68_9CHLO|nr:unnamed protein product [Ostreobium quekettii]
MSTLRITRFSGETRSTGAQNLSLQEPTSRMQEEHGLGILMMKMTVDDQPNNRGKTSFAVGVWGTLEIYVRMWALPEGNKRAELSAKVEADRMKANATTNYPEGLCFAVLGSFHFEADNTTERKARDGHVCDVRCCLRLANIWTAGSFLLDMNHGSRTGTTCGDVYVIAVLALLRCVPSTKRVNAQWIFAARLSPITEEGIP